MYTFLIAIHVIVCIVLTIVILLQSSKGGGLAGVFGGGGGGGGMNAVFGGRGAGSFLSKATTILAISFMVLAMFLGLITKSKQGPTSIVSQERSKGAITSPADVLPTIPSDGDAIKIPASTGTPDDETDTPNNNE